MLTMSAHRRPSQVLIGMLLYGLPVVVSAEGPHPSSSETYEEAGQRQIGAPQVLEIPPVQEIAPPTGTASPVDARPSEMGTPQDDSLRQSSDQPPAARRSYLGLLYVSADNEEDGVVVVDTIVGSPAARAGFIGEKTEVPASRTDQMMKVAIVGLTVSGVGAVAVMPLILAHEMFLACRPRGDVIVAIGDRLVRNAQDFNDEMRHYRPGEQVTFSVKRCGKPAQITAQLEEEPVESLPYDGVEVEDQSPPSYQEPNNVGITTSRSSSWP